MPIRLFIAIVLGLFTSKNLLVLADERDAVLPSLNSAPTTQDTNHAAVSFKLKATAIAPFLATGTGELRVGTLALHLSNLGPGRYELQTVRRLGGVDHLGMIVIVDPTLSPDRQANDNKKEASVGPHQLHLETEVQMTLPTPISPRDIGRLLLVDAGGNAVLSGDAD
jgi:hypothetical protein